ncbi:MAG: intradiol ring-cleavage dioxygenase [Rhizobiales bacterium]|nr:intradiol ring-cleavage dioxygenase [Hyphomicrobiales bacterium]
MARHSRRDILIGSGLTLAGFALPSNLALAQGAELPPTPECRDAHDVTPRQTEGPFYTPNVPERASLREPGMKGVAVALGGLVLTRGCKPVANAVVDLWQADDAGKDDNKGFRLRGFVRKDAQGHYAFQTIQPGLYPGRTRHYHVKVQAPGARLLTTQLYFPDEPGNSRDFLFRKELLIRTAKAADGLAARFDFVADLR